jgi:hypothetical protein
MVTGWPTNNVEGESVLVTIELTTIVVRAGFTVCDQTAEVLGLKFESPLYWAVME